MVIEEKAACNGGREKGKALGGLTSRYPSSRVAVPFVNWRNEARAMLRNCLRIPTMGMSFGKVTGYCSSFLSTIVKA